MNEHESALPKLKNHEECKYLKEPDSKTLI